MPKRIAPSQWHALQAVLVGGLLAGGLYYVLPGLHWGWYAFVGVVGAGAAFQTALEMAAHKKIIDEE